MDKIIDLSEQNTKNISHQWSGLDFLKLFFSFCVVAIHSNLLSSESVASYLFSQLVFRLAIPFFFCTSGFLMNQKVKENSFNLKKYNKRLFEKLLFIEPVSIVMFVAIGLLAGTSVSEIALDVTKRILCYPYGALWYIQAMMVASLFLYMFWRNKKHWLAVIIPAFLYFFALLCSKYYFFAEYIGTNKIIDLYLNIFYSSCNGVFVAPIFMSIGGLINEKYDKIRKVSKCKIIILLVASYLALAFEIIMIINKENHDFAPFYIGYPIFISILLIISLFPKWNCLKISKYSKQMRNYSTSIYLLHSPVLTALRYGTKFVGINLSGALLFLFTVLIVVFIIFIIYKVNSRKKIFFYKIIT